MALLKLLDRDNALPNKLRYRDILASMEPIPGSVCFYHRYGASALNDFIPHF
jgi:hypothetical protein